MFTMSILILNSYILSIYVLCLSRGLCKVSSGSVVSVWLNCVRVVINFRSKLGLESLPCQSAVIVAKITGLVPVSS